MSNDKFASMLGLLAALYLAACHTQSPRSFAEEIPDNPGLREADGRPHPLHAPNPATGRALNVIDFGADPTDNAKDDLPAVRAALLAARPGDEVYFPNGVYNLSTPWDSGGSKDAHIRLASSINLRGESEAGVVLISSFDGGSDARPSAVSYSVMRASGVHDLHVSNMTLTSTWQGAWSSDPTMNNPEAGGPTYMISTGHSGSAYSYNLSFERVTVMKFRRMGFRIDAGSRDVVVKNCTARDATDLGGGGAGYGFVLQGRHPQADDGFNPNAGSAYDNYFNAVIDCSTDGEHIRHSALIQYYSHNNLITGCRFSGSRYGAIDLHGEDEYDNEISHNVIRDMPLGGGVELGNSGATHDRSGPFNWVHHNTMVNCRVGISVEYGTEHALIEDNDISGNAGFANGSGILLGFCSYVTVRRNFIHDNGASGFAGMRLFRNKAENRSRAGSPGNCVIVDNRLLNNAGGLVVSSIEAGNVIERN